MGSEPSPYHLLLHVVFSVKICCVLGRDVALVIGVKQFQKAELWSNNLHDLHEDLAHLDEHLSLFMLAVKRALPQKVISLSHP